MGMSKEDARTLALKVRDALVGAPAADPGFATECGEEISDLSRLCEYVLDPDSELQMPTQGVRAGKVWHVRSPWGDGAGETLVEAMGSMRVAVVEHWGRVLQAAGGKLSPESRATLAMVQDHLDDLMLSMASVAASSGRMTPGLKVRVPQAVWDAHQAVTAMEDGATVEGEVASILFRWCMAALGMFHRSGLLQVVPDEQCKGAARVAFEPRKGDQS